MRNPLILICIIVIVTSSCRKQKRQYMHNIDDSFVYDSIPHKQELYSKKLDLGIIFSPNMIFIVDSSLVVASSGTDYLLSLFNINDEYSKIGNVIQYGQGPDEALSVVNLYGEGLDEFKVHDGSAGWIKDYSLDQNRDSVWAKSRGLTRFNRMSISYLWLVKNKLISTTTDISPYKRLYIYDSVGNFIEAKGDYPYFDRKVEPTVGVEVFTAKAAVRPSDSSSILAYRYTDLIEFYDNESNLVKRVQGPDLFTPKFEVGLRGGYPIMERKLDLTQEAFIHAVASDKEIFLLYAAGKTRKKGEGDLGIHYRHILVMDWQGKPLKHFELDHSIASFGVDWENQTIYGLDKIESEIYTFKYD